MLEQAIGFLPSGSTMGDPADAGPLLEMRSAVLREAVAEFTAAFPGVKPFYATKCNPDPGVLRILGEAGCSFEIASTAELRMLTGLLGVPPEDLIFSNPVRARAQTAEAWSAGVRRFAVDSSEELRRTAAVAPGCDVLVRVATAPGDSLVPSEGKFGVGADDAVRLCREAAELGLNVHGLTFHMGSQTLTPEALGRPMDDVRQVITRIAADGLRIELLDIGGGFPARYAERIPPMAEFGRVFALKIKEFPYEVEAVAEPGRCLVASAGTFRCRVIGVASRHGVRWAHTDLGVFNGMMEALESGGELRYPLSDSRGSGATELFNVTGPTCDSQDTFATGVPLSADLREGDEIFVGSAGAYTATYSTRFHGFPLPRVVII
ncbi:type III PLP-dependent enzyme [Actinoplanes sp. NPDC089786]|uniref:type III PLP-dependent enzyme n=1 Tax=Actinoplanes sp. NPDC089786 TaxID=3155185 RepID=UPI003418EF0E